MLSCFYYWIFKTDVINAIYTVLTTISHTLRLLYQLDVILQHIVKIHYLILFHNNNSQLVINLNYQLDKKELDFMITKTFII